MLRAASRENSWPQGMSSDQKLATTSASTATVNQQALQRALNSGGGNL